MGGAESNSLPGRIGTGRKPLHVQFQGEPFLSLLEKQESSLEKIAIPRQNYNCPRVVQTLLVRLRLKMSFGEAGRAEWPDKHNASSLPPGSARKRKENAAPALSHIMNSRLGHLNVDIPFYNLLSFTVSESCELFQVLFQVNDFFVIYP